MDAPGYNSRNELSSCFPPGNFADVVKHAILSRLVAHLRKKESAFASSTRMPRRIVRSNRPGAVRSPEWRDGIGPYPRCQHRPGRAAIARDYLDAVREQSAEKYPLSRLAALVRAWLRRADVWSPASLSHPPQALAQSLHGDRRVKAVAIDGLDGVVRLYPPKERRGPVLIDPPYD